MRHAGRRRSTFPMTGGPFEYVLGNEVIRKVADRWIAFSAGVQLDGDFETPEDAWDALKRAAYVRHEQARLEEWERMKGERGTGR